MDIQGNSQFYQIKILMPFLYLLWKKQQFSNNPISITLIYRSLKSPLSEFVGCLQYLVGRNIDIFLSDFNIDAFEGVIALNEVFNNYDFPVNLLI